MKYSIHINQKAIVESGVQIDLVEAALLDYVQQWLSSPKGVRMDNHVWINLKTLIADMPCLGLNSKQAISKRLKAMKLKGIFSFKHDEMHRLYVALTDLGFSMCYGRQQAGETVNDETTPVNAGCTEVSTPVEQGCQRSIDIQQSTNEHSTNNHNTNNKGASAKPKKPRSKLDFPDYFTTEMQAAWKARKAANTQIALDAWVRTAKQANDSGLCDELTAVMTGLESGWKGLKLEWLQNSMKPQQRNVQVASDESDSSIFDRLLIGNDDDAINGSCRRVN